MELRYYLAILKRRKLIVLLTALTAVAIAAIGLRFQDPVYSAQVTVRIAQASSDSIEYVDYVYADRLMNTYGEIVESWPVLKEASQQLGLAISPEELAKLIKVELVPNTELLRITVDDPDPLQASRMANVLAALLVEQSQSLYFGGERSAREILSDQLELLSAELQQDRLALEAATSNPNSDPAERDILRTKIALQEEAYTSFLRQYEEARVTEAARANSVTIVEPAVPPQRPSRPQTMLILAASALIGLVAGIALAFLAESIDTALHTTDDLEPIELPLLGTIPWVRLPSERRTGRLRFEQRKPATQEAFAILRTNLLAAKGDGALHSVLITSAEPGVGKSVILANLGVALAEGRRRAVLVDTDLRRPSLHRHFGLPNETGLSQVVRGEASLDEAIQATDYPELRVLTSGAVPLDLANLLASPRMQELIKSLRGDGEMVLLDSPPILAVADAAMLAPLVDGVLLIAGRNQTARQRLERAAEQIETAGGSTLGVVFNGTKPGDSYYYYSYAPAGRWSGRMVARTMALLLLVTIASFLVLAASFDSIGALASRQGFPLAFDTAAEATATPTGAPQPSPLVTPTGLAPTRPLSGPSAAGTGAQATTMAATGEAASLVPTPIPSPSTTARSTLLSAPAPMPAAGVAPEDMPPLLEPTPPFRAGFVLYRSSKLYSDPADPDSNQMVIPANWPLTLLAGQITGAHLYGSNQWYKVRLVVRGEPYVGYVPARHVAEIE